MTRYAKNLGVRGPMGPLATPMPSPLWGKYMRVV